MSYAEYRERKFQVQGREFSEDEELFGTRDAPGIALFTRQPWADLISRGVRSVMVKNWDFPQFRGHFLIHSARRIRAEVRDKFEVTEDARIRQAFVGAAELVDIERVRTEERWRELEPAHLTAGPRPYGDETYVYHLQDQRRLVKPVPVAGVPSGPQWPRFRKGVNFLWDNSSCYPKGLDFFCGRGYNIKGAEPFYMKVPYENADEGVIRTRFGAEYGKYKLYKLQWAE